MKCKGFTIIELIMVIIIIGILAILAIPRIIATSTISAQQAAQMVAADIRRTQDLALSDNSNTYSIGFTLGSGSYTIYKNYPTTFETVSLPSGVTSSTSTRISFDDFGQPTGNPTLTISVGGAATVTVTQYTGYVTVS